MKCAMLGCTSSRYDKGKSFYGFPKDEARCRQWVQKTGRPELMDKGVQCLSKYHGICELHFSPNNRCGKRLTNKAVPIITSTYLADLQNLRPEKSTQTDITLLFTSGDDDDVVPSSSQTIQNLTSNTLKRMLPSHSEVESKKKKINKDQTLASTTQKDNVSLQLLRLINIIQNRLQHENYGNTHDKKFMFSALNIFLANPQAYRVLRKTLNLPRERKLRRINIETGSYITPNLMKSLQSKIKSMKNSQKHCIICADIIPLKRNLYYQINNDRIVGFQEMNGSQVTEPATEALVIMARGIFADWKQPLAYCFLAANKNYIEFQTWLKNALTHLVNIGYNILAFVSNQDSIFWNLAIELNVTEDEPYFLINGQKIYYIFDIRHLVKSLRNSLMKYQFEFHEPDGTPLTATWQDIIISCREDNERGHFLAPKITEAHTKPNQLQRSKVELALEIFSDSVAAAVNCSVALGTLEKTSLGTAKLIGLINKTVNILKSSFAANVSEMQTLNQFMHFLSDVTVYDGNNKNVTNTVKCLKCFKISLRSIINIAQGLKQSGFDHLPTRRLHTDALENIISSIRKQVGTFKKLEPIQFCRPFSQLVMDNLLNCTNNSSYDLDQLLMNINDYTSDVIGTKDAVSNNGGSNNNITGNNKSLDTTESDNVIAVGTDDYRFELPEENAIKCISGYLLKKCCDMHKCVYINRFVEAARQDSNIFLHYNSYTEKKMYLINPPESFINLVVVMDRCLKRFFREKKRFVCVGHQILYEMHEITSYNLCPCFPVDYLKKIFFRWRLFNIIQFNNKQFKDKSVKQKSFSICDI